MFAEKYNLEYDKYKESMTKIRNKVNEILTGGNNIDKLMKDKIEDYILIEEQSLPIQIGDRTIFVGNFTYKNEQKFFNRWAKIMSAMNARIVNFELAEERRKELLEKASFHLLAEGKWMLEFLMIDNWLFKQLCVLIDKYILRQQAYYLNNEQVRKKLKWKNCSRRYFEKYVTKEKLIQICFLIYFFNFDAEKKNIQVVLEKMCMKSLAETYMYSWLSGLGGTTGKYLAAQAPSTDYAFRDVLNKPVPENHKRRGQILMTPSKTEGKENENNGKT